MNLLLLLLIVLNVGANLNAGDKKEGIKPPSSRTRVMQRRSSSDQKKPSYSFSTTPTTFQSESPITDLARHPNGLQVAIGETINKITEWNSFTNDSYTLPTPSAPSSIIYSPDGSLLAHANIDAQCVTIWTDDYGRQISIGLGQANYCRAIFDPTSKRLVYARYCPEYLKDSDAKLCLFDIQSQKITASSTDNMVVRDMTWLGDPTLAIGHTSWRNDGSITLYDTRDMKATTSWDATIQSTKNQVGRLDDNSLMYNNGKHLATRDIRNPQKIVATIKHPDGNDFESFDLSPDQEIILIESSQKPRHEYKTRIVELLDRKTGKCIAKIDKQKNKLAPYEAAFSSDMRAIIGQTSAFTVAVWERLDTQKSEPEDADEHPFQALSDKVHKE